MPFHCTVTAAPASLGVTLNRTVRFSTGVSVISFRAAPLTSMVPLSSA